MVEEKELIRFLIDMAHQHLDPYVLKIHQCNHMHVRVYMCASKISIPSRNLQV